MVARLSTHATGITVFNIRNLKGWNSAITSGNIKTAVEDAQDIANDAGVPLYIPNQTPGTGAYASLNLPFNSTITLTGNPSIILDMTEPMYYTGSADEPAIVIGGENEQTFHNIVRLWVYRNTLADWTDEECCGIRLINFYRCTEAVLAAQRFTVGVQCLGSGSLGFAYNSDIKLLLLKDNLVNLDLQRKKNVTGGAYNNTQGWVNSNHFRGGQFSTDSSTYVAQGSPSATQPVGIRLSAYNADATYLLNQNKFDGSPTFELATSGFPAGCIPFLISCSALLNRIDDARTENLDNTTPFMKITATTGVIKNRAHIAYHGNGGNLADAMWVDDQGTSNYGNSVTTADRQAITPFSTSGPTTYEEFGKRATHYMPTGELFLPGWGWRITGIGDNTLRTYSRGQIHSVHSSGYLIVASGYNEGPAKAFRTTNCKTIGIQTAYETSYSGRIMVQCFDAAGAVLGSTYSGKVGSASGPKYLTGEYMAWSSSYNGCFLSQANKPYVIIHLHDDVKSIHVAYVQNTTEMRAWGMNVYGVDGFLPDITPAPHGLGERWAYENPDARIATATCSLSGDGIDTTFTITNAGGSYTSAPTISFSGGGGTGAAATCTVSAAASGGEVLTITRTAAGSGYSSPPTMTFSEPDDKTFGIFPGEIIRNANFTGGSADIWGWVRAADGTYDKVASAVV